LAFRIKDVAQNQEKLLKLIADIYAGLHTEHWTELDKQSEKKGQRLILLIYPDSYTVIQRTGYKIFIDFSQGLLRC
jgi:hypothetical protein